MPQSQYIQGAFVAVDQKKALWQTLLVLLALALTIAQYFSILPEWLFRVPAAVLPPLERWLDAFFNFVKDDLKLIVLTRFLTEGLQFILDATANILYGKRFFRRRDVCLDGAYRPVETGYGNALGSGCGGAVGLHDRTSDGHRRLEKPAGGANRPTGSIGAANAAFFHLSFAGSDFFQGGPHGRCCGNNGLCDSANDFDDHFGP
jgi:hypothetical protein